MMLAWQKQQVSKVGPHFLFFLVGEGILSPFDSTVGLLVNDCGPLNEPLGVGPGWENASIKGGDFYWIFGSWKWPLRIMFQDGLGLEISRECCDWSFGQV